MKVKAIIFSLLTILCCCPALAQFYNAGEDAGSLKWRSVRTDNYHVIYPRGLDSLARVFAEKLEEVRTPVSASLGYSPNGLRTRRMPVVLHSGTSQSNGMVGSTPYQMDLYTVPDAYGPLALPWTDQLIIHESRHAAQQQVGFEKRFLPFRILLGDMFLGGMSGLYGGLLFFEGDAVLAETALTRSGRGRSADFLEYYMMAFENGLDRSFYQWRYGSLNRYTPNHYALGYVTLAGTRALFDDPALCQEFYRNVVKHTVLPFPFLRLRKTTVDAGGYDLKKNFIMVKGHFASEWALAAEKRAPFQNAQQLTADTPVHTEYRSTLAQDGRVWAIRSSLNSTSELVSIDTCGTYSHLSWLSPVTSKLSIGGKRLYWSEDVPDIRWSLKSNSCIWYYDIESGEKGRLTKEGRLYNPAPCRDGSRLAVTVFPETGGSSVDIIDAATGAVLESIQAPDSLQFAESVWVGDKLFVSGVSQCGAGIYELCGGSVLGVAGPWPYQIKQLRSDSERLTFVCDASGVNEIYSLTPGSTALSQLSSSRFGSAEYAIDGNAIYFGTLSPSGRHIYKAEEVPSRPADFSTLAPHRTAEIISRQDARLLEGVPSDTASITEARNYSKAAHLFRIHSWAPLYIDYDEVMDMSYESITAAAGLGGTVFFQNHLGTSCGSIGLEFVSPEKVAGHLKMTYKGLFPVFEGNLNVSTSTPLHYHYLSLGDDRFLSGRPGKGTGINGNIKVYVPLTLSRGGWNRGIIPQINYSVSNSTFNTSEIQLDYYPAIPAFSNMKFCGVQPGPTHLMQVFNASLRAYSMLSVAHSNIFPRLGIGAEAGLNFRPGLEKILAPVSYAHVYGYLPGLHRAHGLRLGVAGSHSIGSGLKESMVSLAPRGLSDANAFLNSTYRNLMKLSADYAMPVLPVDWSCLGPVVYLRNFELIPHADITFFGSSDSAPAGNLLSAGATFNAVFTNLPADVRLGITCSWNAGNAFDYVQGITGDIKRFHAGLSMSVDL